MYKMKFKKEKGVFFAQGKVYETKEEAYQGLLDYYSGKVRNLQNLSFEEILMLADLELAVANPVQCKATFKIDADVLEIYVNGYFLGTTALSQMSPEVRKQIFNG